MLWGRRRPSGEMPLAPGDGIHLRNLSKRNLRTMGERETTHEEGGEGQLRFYQEGG